MEKLKQNTTVIQLEIDLIEDWHWQNIYCEATDEDENGRLGSFQLRKIRGILPSISLSDTS